MQSAINGVGQLLPRFFGWWLGELAALVPARLRRVMLQRTDVLCFAFAGQEIVIRRYVDDARTRIARIDLEGQDAAAQRAAVEAIVHSESTRRTSMVITLPAGNALHKRLDLPLAAESGLKDLLYFELDRQTPYRAEQVRYDYRIVSRDPETQRIVVELLVVPRDAVDRAVGLAAGWGLPVSAITVEGVDDPAQPEFDLAGERHDVGPSRVGGLFSGLLALSALALLGAAVYVPLDAQRRAADDAQRAVAEALNAAKEASALRDELDRTAEAGNFLLERKRNEPMVTAVLADLTRLFPDDTWLFELQIDGHQIRARGYTPSASSVLELVERGSAFRNAKFASPVTRIQNFDRDRFDLTFDLVREGGA